MGGERLNSVQLQKAKTQNDFVQTLKEYAQTISHGDWITGGDWDHYDWGTQLPDRHLVDKVTQNNPVWIGRHEGHMYLANTLALQICGNHYQPLRLAHK
jgi:predicted amidohydrolase YtcJ